MASNAQRIFVPALGPEDVIRHLGKGVIHWKEGFSAYSLARAWFGAKDYPEKIRALIDSADAFRGAHLLDGFLERSIDLGDGGRPSQTDILTIARLDNKLSIVAIEGKVDEPFGKPVFEWLDEGPKRASREARLRRLSDILGIERVDEGLRYQLFHRAASTVIEAERYCTDSALLIIHSFSTKQSGLEDCKAFVRALGVNEEALPNNLTQPVMCRVNGKDIALYFGWVSDTPHLGEFWSRLRVYAEQTAAHAQAIEQWIAQRSPE